MTRMKLNPDSRHRAYKTNIRGNNNWNRAQEIMAYLGHLKRQDYKQATQKTTYKQRHATLKQAGINDVHAKTLISDNDAQLSRAWENHKDNRRDWHRDVTYAKNTPKTKPPNAKPSNPKLI